MAKKTNSGDIQRKLDIRRHFLNRYHDDREFEVYDACQGDGMIWAYLRREFSPTRYWGTDTKGKRGRVTADSVDVLELGVNADVIDIDSAGHPWRHWRALLPHIKKPTTVFLTIGRTSARYSPPAKYMLESVDFPMNLPVPTKMLNRVCEHAILHVIGKCREYGYRPVEIASVDRSKSKGGADFYGVHLEPIS